MECMRFRPYARNRIKHTYNVHAQLRTTLWLYLLSPDASTWSGICYGNVAVCVCVCHANDYHVLYPYLPENQYQHYHLRQRPHSKAIIPIAMYVHRLGLYCILLRVFLYP